MSESRSIELGIQPRADWRDPEQYRNLLEYDCVGWAGEWLRRNPDFVADVLRVPCLPYTAQSPRDDDTRISNCGRACTLSRWGLRCCRIDEEPVFFWLPQCNPLVLPVETIAAPGPADAFDIRRCASLKAGLRGVDRELHLLFSDGPRTLQIVLIDDPPLDGPVMFRCRLCGWCDFEAKPLSLRRLCSLYRRGRLLKTLYPPEQRARRWMDMARAWDGLKDGARQRDIAAALFGERAARTGWDDGYRTRVQRLVRAAERMVGGGYLGLLRGEEEGEFGPGSGEP
ncbi:hypothetical protein GALL_173980 [mine drainage metagenome]|uniref:DUF2285 domain-containing protein n=1 Tax=mine drainage metagenome TaxID=410659 RepID=A0A1J5S8I4_9ZZZZ